MAWTNTHSTYVRSDMRGASQALEDNLALLGHPVPKGNLLPYIFKEFLVQVIHSYFPKLRGTRKYDHPKAKEDLESARLFGCLASVWFSQKAGIPALWAQLCGLNLSEKYESTGAEAADKMGPLLEKSEDAAPLSLAVQFDAVLNVGRKISSALYEQEVYLRIQDAVLNLLRAEDCLIFQVFPASKGGESHIQVLLGNSKRAFDLSLINQAIRENKVLVLNEGRPKDRSEARSVMCAPISVRDNITRLFYAPHKKLAQPFSDEERRLAEFIATLAGAALENAEGFMEIQTLSNSLRQDVGQRLVAEKDLQDALIEKEVLLREVYHRTKNNMQLISSLINLQAVKVTNPGDREVFRESQDKIRSMALVHEKLYQSKDLVNIDLKDYLSDLVNGLIQSINPDPNRIGVKMALEPISMEIDSVLPCGLVVNELVSNSMKYAFPSPRKGFITVALRKVASGSNTLGHSGSDEDLNQIMVSDDGVGLPDGFDITQVKSLGMRLVQGIVEGQLHGKLEVKNRKGMGCEFLMTFKNQTYKKRV